MKNKSLSIAFFLFVSSHIAFAQKNLPPSVQAHLSDAPVGLVSILHRAGFEWGSDRVGQAAGNTHQRDMLRLDSTKTFYAYNPATGDSTPLSRTHYLYPSSNSKTEIIFQFNNGQWMPLNRATYVADEQQRLTEVLAEVFDTIQQAYYLESRLTIFPHGDSPDLIDSIFTYAYDTTAQTWYLLLANRNVFDTQDRLQESYTMVDYFGSPVVFKDLYFYDENGDNVLIEESGLFDGEETPTGKTEMNYVDHQLIESTHYVTDGVNFYPEKRNNYAYTLFGAMRKEMNFVYDVAIENFRLRHTTDFFYDAQQRLAGKENTEIQPNAWDVKERISYAYKQDEDLYMEFVHFWDDDQFDWILDSKKYYYYQGSTNVDPTPGIIDTLAISPNPGTGVFRLNLGSEAIVKVFDTTGKMLQSSVLQSGQQLDITALPPGVYALVAQEEQRIYNGKIVKQ